MSAELNRKWPLDSVVQRYWLPTIAAAIALDKHDAERAIESLGVMGTYEMSIEGYLDPVYLRGQAYLMQSYSLQGDTAKAHSAYQDFLALWKDADPDVPILKEAKAEYEKFQ